ncbi:MAG: hypothetical protein ACOH1T_10405 [Microbacteriaceae bacterium]
MTIQHELEHLISETIAALESAGIADEALAVREKPRLRKPLLRSVGNAWRLGILLIDRSGNLYQTGDVTRAIEPQIAVNSRTLLAEARRDDRRAAVRGRFAEGTVVNFDFLRIPLEPLALGQPSGPLSVENGVVRVRWQPSGGTMPLARYLDDRVALLVE